MAGINDRKYYVTKSGLGYEEGVYTAEEIAKLPKGAIQNMIPLSVAIAKKYVNADYSSGSNINELSLHANVDPKTGQERKLHGVAPITSKKSIFSKATSSEEGRLTNSLQKKFQDAKKQQAEDSLKAKIAAAKASKSK